MQQNLQRMMNKKYAMMVSTTMVMVKLIVPIKKIVKMILPAHKNMEFVLHLHEHIDLPPFFVPPLKLEFMFKQTVGA